MLRRTPLRRKTRLRSRGDTKHARRERDFEYMGFVVTLPCAARLLEVGGMACAGRIQADHVGGRYGANSDRRCVPMCEKHHQDRTGRVGGGGVFAGWPVARRRAWGADAIAATLAAWEGRA